MSVFPFRLKSSPPPVPNWLFSTTSRLSLRASSPMGPKVFGNRSTAARQAVIVFRIAA